MPSKKQGATSILVIVMMVVLIVLGLAILTTSLSGMRLSEKKQAWLASYYALEAKSQRALAEVHTHLITSSSRDTLKSSLSKTLSSYEPKWSQDQSGNLVLEFTVSTEGEKPEKHITTSVSFPNTANSNLPPLQFEVIAYKQWQDAFEFSSLPGFEDPLTETPEFNLDPSKP